MENPKDRVGAAGVLLTFLTCEWYAYKALKAMFRLADGYPAISFSAVERAMVFIPLFAIPVCIAAFPLCLYALRKNAPRRGQAFWIFTGLAALCLVDTAAVSVFIL